MNKKTIIKTAADLLMSAALPVLMCYSLITETAHEIVGLVMFALFILHHILNFGWTKALFKGKYPPKRIVGTAINALVLICMLGQMYSSLVISKHIFTFLDLSGAGFARTVHLLCAYWGFAMMSVHLGMHLRQIAARLKLKSGKLRIALLIVFSVIAALGVYEFIQLGLFGYMFGQVQFVFIDTSVPAVVAALRYICAMVLFAEVGYLADRLLSAKTGGNNKDSHIIG